MQKSYIIIDVDTKTQMDSSGYYITKSSDYPTIERGQWQILCVQFMRRSVDDLGVISLSEASFEANSSFVFVADNDFNDDNQLMLKSFQSVVPFSATDPESNRFNIEGDWIDGGTADITKGQMSIRINADTEKFATVTGTQKTVTKNLYVNIKQYITGLQTPCSVAWFPFIAQNTIRDWKNPEEYAPEGIVVTPFIVAYLKNPMEFQFSVDGINDWHATQTVEDYYYRQRISNLDIEWSSAIRLIQGVPGVAGQDGQDGYTPLRGVDYWTDADKAEIRLYVDEQILNGEW